MDITAVAGLAYLATLCVFIFGILSSALHMLFAGVRKLRGHPSRLNWLIAGRWLCVLACLIWLLAAFLLTKLLDALHLVPAGNDTVVGVLAIIGFVPLFLLPVGLPLFEIWRYRRASSLMLAAASVIAFPVVIAVTANISYTLATDAGMPHLEGGVIAPGYKDADLYAFRPIKPKGQAIAHWLKLPDLGSRWVTAEQFERERAALWFEMSANDVSFEWLNDAGWHFSQFEFNTEDSFFLAALPYVYRLAYVALFWAVAFVLARELYRSIARAIRRHAAADPPEEIA